jgi:hypothetical protein
MMKALLQRHKKKKEDKDKKKKAAAAASSSSLQSPESKEATRMASVSKLSPFLILFQFRFILC